MTEHTYSFTVYGPTADAVQQAARAEAERYFDTRYFDVTIVSIDARPVTANGTVSGRVEAVGSLRDDRGGPGRR